MKRYYATAYDALRALHDYERKTLDRPSKEELRVRKVGKGKRAYLVATDQELFYKRMHGLSLKSL
jgi:hypothetical protein